MSTETFLGPIIKRWEGETLRISNSEIQVFKDCRRKWWLVYYRELGPKRTSESPVGAANLGTKVHIALHALYTKDDANPVQIINDLYDDDVAFIRDNDEFFSEEVIISLRNEQDLAHAMITGFLQWREEEGIDVGMELLAAESVVEVPSNIENVLLRGKMDQRWLRKSDGRRLFRDWKTTQSLTIPQQTLPLDEQMKFYHLLEYLEALQKTGNEPEWRTDGALYSMLRKVKRSVRAKPPFYGQIEVHHNKAELHSIWMRVSRIIFEIVTTREELDAGGDPLHVVPPRPSRDCTWKCQFFAACPMFDDGSNVEGFLAERYEKIDPHRRYNEEENEKGVIEG